MLFGMLILSAAKSAIHEIEAFIVFLIAAVLLSGAAIVDAIINARTQLETTFRPAQGTSTNNKPPPLPTPARYPAPSESDVDLPDESTISEIDQLGDDEELADEMFNDAKDFASDGKKEKAISTLREIVRRYPDTQAAEKARRNLQKNPTSP
ncbi:MAG: hypothetical protein JWN70_1767 [Planctomycetaceae bacterium]|nr:hypothetical protein [Planctomycetaceae bacterium]